MAGMKKDGPGCCGCGSNIRILVGPACGINVQITATCTRDDGTVMPPDGHPYPGVNWLNLAPGRTYHVTAPSPGARYQGLDRTVGPAGGVYGLPLPVAAGFVCAAGCSLPMARTIRYTDSTGVTVDLGYAGPHLNAASYWGGFDSYGRGTAPFLAYLESGYGYGYGGADGWNYEFAESPYYAGGCGNQFFCPTDLNSPKTLFTSTVEVLAGGVYTPKTCTFTEVFP